MTYKRNYHFQLQQTEVVERWFLWKLQENSWFPSKCQVNFWQIKKWKLIFCWFLFHHTHPMLTEDKKKSMVVSTPVGPVCQPSPAAASYWPASACPSSPAEEPLFEEAAAQPEMLGAHLEPRPRCGGPLLGRWCFWLASQSGAWLGRPGWGRAWRGERREEEGGRRCPIHPATSLLFFLYPLHRCCLCSVLSAKRLKGFRQEHTAGAHKYHYKQE